jgi:3-dehydroquinate synthase
MAASPETMPVIQRFIQVGWPLRVFFTENVFAPDNLILRDVLAEGGARKALVVLEDSLAQALPELETRIQQYFAAHTRPAQLVRPPLYVCGGERAKNSDALVGKIYSQLQHYHVDRHSCLIAVGGGALLDVAGFAAATAHRGVRLVRVPTTTLSQADAGVGVKNGLNAFGQKNFIGTYAPPYAVINDFQLIEPLAPRDKRSGYAEAVKVACLREAAFFEALEGDAEKLAAFEPAAMKRLIFRCAELHLDQIATGGDPFESGSARPLDFGHWAAHKLEQLSHFRMAHGEAVAVGLALDVIYSRNTGLLAAAPAARILNLLERLGLDLFAGELLNTDRLGTPVILSGLEEFREHLGGDLSVTMLTDIGHHVEVHELDPRVIAAAIGELRARKRG